MLNSKLKSFTLSEMLIVMIITAIVVGMAFSVLRLVQKEIHLIKKNFEVRNSLGLFEQRLWQDFHTHTSVQLLMNKKKLVLESELDTIAYVFNETYTLRNNDTIKLKLQINTALYQGAQRDQGSIDAIQVFAERELPKYSIFVSKKNDLTNAMNKDGF